MRNVNRGLEREDDHVTRFGVLSEERSKERSLKMEVKICVVEVGMCISGNAL